MQKTKIKNFFNKVNNNWFLQIFGTNFNLLWKNKSVFALGITFITITSVFLLVHLLMGAVSPDIYIVMSPLLNMIQLIITLIFFSTYIILGLIFLYKDQADNDIHNIELRSGVQPWTILIVRYLVFLLHGIIVTSVIFFMSLICAAILASPLGTKLPNFIALFGFYYFYLIFFSGIALFFIAICSKVMSTLITVVISIAIPVAPMATAITFLVSGDIQTNSAISSINQRLYYGSKFYNFLESEDNKVFGNETDQIDLYQEDFFDILKSNNKFDPTDDYCTDYTFNEIFYGYSSDCDVEPIQVAFAAGMFDGKDGTKDLFKDTWLQDFAKDLYSELQTLNYTFEPIFGDKDQFSMQPLQLLDNDRVLDFLIKNSQKYSGMAKFIKNISKEFKEIMNDYHFAGNNSKNLISGVGLSYYSFLSYYSETNDGRNTYNFVTSEQDEPNGTFQNSIVSAELLNKYELRGILWIISQLWTMLFTATPSAIPESQYNFGEDAWSYFHDSNLTSFGALKDIPPTWVLDIIREQQDNFSLNNKINIAGHVNFITTADVKTPFTSDIIGGSSQGLNLSGVSMRNTLDLPEKGSNEEKVLRNSLGWIKGRESSIEPSGEMDDTNKNGVFNKTTQDFVIVKGIGKVHSTMNVAVVVVVWLLIAIGLTAVSYPIYVRKLRI